MSVTHRRSRIAQVSVSLALLLFATCTAGQAQSAQRVNLPRFDKASCPFKLGAGLTQGQDVRCGYLVVPEDRSKPNGPSIRLSVAVFRSPSAHRAPDPIIFLQGGPGGAIVHDLGSLIDASDAGILLGRHDLVLIDQRGTGYSRPALGCYEINNLIIRTLAQNLSPERQVALTNPAVRRCRDRLARTVNLNAYSTLEDAADIADLRQVLGYKQVDLYGVSYGSRLALAIMRRYPAGIRSVVLDSVYAPEVNSFTDPSRSEAHLFQLIFSACAKAAQCHRRYPQLGQVFYRTVTRLDAKPAIIGAKDAISGKRYRVLINGDGLAGLISNVPYVAPLIATVPQMIYQAWHGKYGLVSQAFGQVGFTFEGVDLGVYYSVECAEDAPFTSPKAISASVQALPGLLRHYQLVSMLGEYQACGIWHVKPVDRSQKQPVRSSIPTLILEGQYDPITPPADGLLAAKTLSHSYFFQFPGIGHAVRFSDLCPNSIALAFYDNPGRKPASGCISHMHGPFP